MTEKSRQKFKYLRTKRAKAFFNIFEGLSFFGRWESDCKGLMYQMVMPIFDHAHPKIIEITFSFPEFPPACKKSVHSINSFLRYSHIESDRVPWPDCPKSFLTMRTQNFFDQFLIDLNLYQHAKNQVISLICSGDMVD